MDIDELGKIGISRIERIRVRNALNPILWLSVAAAILFLPAAWFFRDDGLIATSLIVLASVPTIAAVVAYMILLFKSPDRLQSEEYQLRQRAMQMIFRRGRKRDIIDLLSRLDRLGELGDTRREG